MARRLLACFGRRGSSSLSTVDEGGEGPIVVELFSSQGCATSPEAEVLISRLGRGDFGVAAPVVILAFHVDYWDYRGWKDPYGSSQWTVRQKDYVEALKLDNIFTPQLVVQGRAQCAANDQEAFLSLIAAAPRFPAPAFQASFTRPTSECLQVTLTGSLRTKIDGSGGVDIMVALCESGLVNDCGAGENKGKVLSNDFVVRKLERLCSVKDMSPKKKLSETLTFTLWDSFNASKCAIAVFIQNGAHHIFGSQSFQLPEDI